MASFLRQLRAIPQTKKQSILRASAKRWRQLALSPALIQSLTLQFAAFASAGGPGWKSFLSMLPSLDLTFEQARDCLLQFLEAASFFQAASGNAAVSNDELQRALIHRLRESFFDHRETRIAITEKLGALLLTAHEGAVPPNSFLQIARDISGADAVNFFALNSGRQGFQMRGSISLFNVADRTYSLTAKENRSLAPGNLSSDGCAGMLDDRWTDRYSDCLSVPVHRGEQVCGLLQLGFSSDPVLLPSDISLLQRTAEYLWSSIVSSDLLREIEGRELRMRETAQTILHVGETERLRISKELHDDSAQSLAVIRLQLEMLEMDLPPDDAQRERIGEIRTVVERTILEIRRLISDLSPAVLEQLGLQAAIRQLANRYGKICEWRLHLRLDEVPALDRDCALVLYRIAQECLANIRRHAEAKTVTIRLEKDHNRVHLTVADDGIGFAFPQLVMGSEHWGLIGMRERVTLLSGEFQVISHTTTSGKGSKKNRGTEVKVVLPFANIL